MSSTGRIKFGWLLIVLALAAVGLAVTLLSGRRTVTELESVSPGAAAQADKTSLVQGDILELGRQAVASEENGSDNPSEVTPAYAPSEPNQSEKPSLSIAAQQAVTEIDRIGQKYAQFLRAYETQSPMARPVARSLLLRCIYVKLDGQGRGELLDPRGQSGLSSAPASTEYETVFLTEGRLYRFDNTEFPLIARVGIAIPGGSGPEGTLALEPFPPELRTEVEEFMNTTLTDLSKKAAGN